MNERQRQRVRQKGPKRILTCDGGGILGLMSVEILAKIEAVLRDRSGNRKLLLADYFDFVCGTSTGAIIATCIAIGMEVEQIRAFYLQSGPLMFEKASLVNRLRYHLLTTSRWPSCSAGRSTSSLDATRTARPPCSATRGCGPCS